jgi:hypothetical protein
LDTFCIYKALPFRDVMEYEIKKKKKKKSQFHFKTGSIFKMPLKIQ